MTVWKWLIPYDEECWIHLQKHSSIGSLNPVNGMASYVQYSRNLGLLKTDDILWLRNENMGGWAVIRIYPVGTVVEASDVSRS